MCIWRRMHCYALIKSGFLAIPDLRKGKSAG